MFDPAVTDLAALMLFPNEHEVEGARVYSYLLSGAPSYRAVSVTPFGSALVAMLSSAPGSGHLSYVLVRRRLADLTNVGSEINQRIRLADTEQAFCLMRGNPDLLRSRAMLQRLGVAGNGPFLILAEQPISDGRSPFEQDKVLVQDLSVLPGGGIEAWLPAYHELLAGALLEPRLDWGMLAVKLREAITARAWDPAALLSVRNPG